MICNHCGLDRRPLQVDHATSHVCRSCAEKAGKISPGAPPLDPKKKRTKRAK
jgi:ribosome-binding protein aMBF1 (putative translation factor)